MSEPYWVPLSATDVPFNYMGPWSSSVSYVPGQVVSRNGIYWLAADPSLNSDPGVGPSYLTATFGQLVTALPGSPTDGQEVTLVDSFTAPTYAWRLKYVAAKVSNKWVFIGGSQIYAEVVTSEGTVSTTYVDLATVGPSIVLPVAGDYIVDHGAEGQGGATANPMAYMSYAIGGTAAVDADAASHQFAPNTTPMLVRRRKKTGLGAVTLLAKYRLSTGGSGTITFDRRWLAVTPIAVGG